jgi:hypothetical protein
MSMLNRDGFRLWLCGVSHQALTTHLPVCHHCHVVDVAVVCFNVQAASAAAATDEYEAAINRTASELYSALDSAMESKS